MIVSIHQPNYLPYLGFIDKMKKSDVFIIYDDAQFNKEDFQHRNRIRIFQGWKWLTVPVEKKRNPINEIRINNDLRWKDITWNEVHLKEMEWKRITGMPHISVSMNLRSEVFIRKNMTG